MKILLSAVLLFTLTASGADLTGKYTGTIEFQNPNGESRKSEAYLELKMDGEKLTGVAGGNEADTHPITNAKLDGDSVSFDVDAGGRLMKLVLKHDNGKLKGEATSERDGVKMKALLELSKK